MLIVAVLCFGLVVLSISRRAMESEQRLDSLEGKLRGLSA